MASRIALEIPMVTPNEPAPAIQRRTTHPRCSRSSLHTIVDRSPLRMPLVGPGASDGGIGGTLGDPIENVKPSELRHATRNAVGTRLAFSYARGMIRLLYEHLGTEDGHRTMSCRAGCLLRWSQP